jgi:CheY-like chemotaxis protein
MQHLANILLVEDSEDDYEAMMRSLKRNNFLNPVRWCRCGQEALDYLYRRGNFAVDTTPEQPDLILLDLNLPGLDGRHVLRTIKVDPALCSIPVIILTTSSDEVDIRNCYAMGANTYVQKPVHPNGLTEAIGRLKDYWFGLAILPIRASSGLTRVATASA